MDFIKDNYEWLFSGIGGVIILEIVRRLYCKKNILVSKKNTTGNGSPIIDGKGHQVDISVRKRK